MRGSLFICKLLCDPVDIISHFKSTNIWGMQQIMIIENAAAIVCQLFAGGSILPGHPSVNSVSSLFNSFGYHKAGLCYSLKKRKQGGHGGEEVFIHSLSGP